MGEEQEYSRVQELKGERDGVFVFLHTREWMEDLDRVPNWDNRGVHMPRVPIEGELVYALDRRGKQQTYRVYLVEIAGQDTEYQAEVRAILVNGTTARINAYPERTGDRSDYPEP